MQYFFLFKTLVDIISPAGGKLRTADFYGREMPFVVCQGRMAFQRAAWLRNRQAFLSLCRDRTNNYDLQLIYNFYEFLVPLFLDLPRYFVSSSWHPLLSTSAHCQCLSRASRCLAWTTLMHIIYI